MDLQTVQLRMESSSTRSEWLQARCKSAGGSDIHSIITGENAWAVWAKATGVIPVDCDPEAESVSDSPSGLVPSTYDAAESFLEWGHDVEPGAVRFYRRFLLPREGGLAGAYVQHYDNAIMRHPDGLPIHASPDALVFRGNELSSPLIRGHDAKNVSNPETASLWGKAGSDEIPETALYQGVGYCSVFDVERWDFTPILWGRAPVMFTVWRNPSAEDEILGRLADWWDHHVVKGNEPEPDGGDRTSKSIKALLGSSTTVEVLPETPEMRAMAVRAARAKAALKRAKAEADAATNACRLATGEAHAGVGELWSYKTNAKGVRTLTLNRQLMKEEG